MVLEGWACEKNIASGNIMQSGDKELEAIRVTLELFT